MISDAVERRAHGRRSVHAKYDVSRLSSRHCLAPCDFCCLNEIAGLLERIALVFCRRSDDYKKDDKEDDPMLRNETQNSPDPYHGIESKPAGNGYADDTSKNLKELLQVKTI